MPRRRRPHQLDPSEGGYARADALSARRRSEIARQAALARWGPPRDTPEHASERRRQRRLRKYQARMDLILGR